MKPRIDLRKTDLNLLVVLDVLLQERNVTRAAARLFRSQSAVSHALARLREQLGDPLLVKVGSEMRPTPRAERLAPELSRLLTTIGRVLGEDEAFDPATTTRAFTLVAPDFIVSALPILLSRMTTEAPHATIELLAPSRTMYRDAADGRFDVVVARPPEASVEGLRTAPLAELHWSVFMRAGHPALADWGVEAWAACRHILIRTSSGSLSPVDEAVTRHGIARPAGLALPNFMLAPPLLAQTDLLLTVPNAVLASVAEAFGLDVRACPVDVPPIEHIICWSAQRDRDPALTWFRRVVVDAIGDHLRQSVTPSTEPLSHPARA